MNELSSLELMPGLSVNPKTGAALPTVENILCVLRYDRHFEGIRFNEVSGSGEKYGTENGVRYCRKWCDDDEAAARYYIEKTYGIYAPNKLTDAMRVLFRERSYNPIIDLVEGEKWDGEERIGQFLIKWAGVEDTAYAREVSRLIFAGGIHRLYAPGTKFDDVPILIGTKQGEGKSSLVRWLAINDEYYGEVNSMEGQEAIEQLSGKWICEISELLALTKNKEQEACKAYITRTVDSYRKPYDRSTTDLPRRCVFIGTTNNAAPLVDKTGNRRYYPVTVNSSGYWLYDHERECREYIIQCWAEAREKYKAGKMPNYADRNLGSEYKRAQDEAMQDDWRTGAIEKFLSRKAPGELTCVREISHRALSPNPDFPIDPSLTASRDIAQIMDKMEDWEKAGVRSVGDYGRQRAWRKINTGQMKFEDEEELPI